jgi:hypothetical protein
MGTLDAIHSVRKVIRYFNSHGSTVNIGVVDLRKAFDKTNIYGILNILKVNNVNPFIIRILHCILSNQRIKTKLHNHFSDEAILSCGVRQGGILSPLLFAIYVDIVLTKLENSGHGCRLGLKCCNSYMYADDLILLSISISDLQTLFDICSTTFGMLDLPINYAKSSCLRIGPRWRAPCEKIIVDDHPLNWVSEIKC